MKYDNVNPIEKLHEGEIYFFLRAQDKLAPKAVQAYAHELIKASDMEEDPHRRNDLYKQAIECMSMAARMLDWQLDHKDLVKLPD